MDEKNSDSSERKDDVVRVEPELTIEPSSPSPSASVDLTPDEFSEADPHPAPPKPSKIPLILSVASIIVAIGVAGAAATLHLANQNEIIRLSNEVAQLRVSLDLYARGSNSNAGAEQLKAVTERLSALEESVEAQASAATALPPLTAPEGAPTASPETTTPQPTAAAGNNEDCLPPGMRLLVAAGDDYPICGTAAKVEVSMVDSGYISLVDGTIVPSGVAVPLPNSSCTVSVTSSGDEGLTGYAEIRVTC